MRIHLTSSLLWYVPVQRIWKPVFSKDMALFLIFEANPDQKKRFYQCAKDVSYSFIHNRDNRPRFSLSRAQGLWFMNSRFQDFLPISVILKWSKWQYLLANSLRKSFENNLKAAAGRRGSLGSAGIVVLSGLIRSLCQHRTLSYGLLTHIILIVSFRMVFEVPPVRYLYFWTFEFYVRLEMERG